MPARPTTGRRASPASKDRGPAHVARCCRHAVGEVPVQEVHQLFITVLPRTGCVVLTSFAKQ